MVISEAIKSSYLAKGLSDSQVETLVKFATTKTFTTGEEILVEGDESRDLMILAKGTAYVKTIVGDPIAYLRPGMPMGEIALLDESPRSGTIVAQEDCVVIVLHAESLLEIWRNSSDLAARCLLNISRVLCARLRSANRNLAALMAVEEAEAENPKH